MKTIPKIYWKENYEKPPTLLQKAWVQRWLELLDPNTSYIYTPPLVNVVGVLDEVVNGFEYYDSNPNKKYPTRTYFFLLCELERCYRTDPVLLEDSCKRFWEIVNPLLCDARELFKWNGCKEEGIPNSDLKAFAQRFEEFRAKNCKAFLGWLCKENRYRNLVCQILECKLLKDGDIDELSRQDAYNIYKNLDELSKNLIIELLTRGNFSVSFLSRCCVDIFLQRRGGENFDSRLSEFLNRFKQPDCEFVVYMRIQARRTIRDIGKIGEITFQPSIPRIVPLIEEIRAQKNWLPQKESHAKDFFYNGRTSENLTFAIATDIRAEDPGNAAIQALAKLNAAIQQAKFEYELKGFSIDRRVYVYDRGNGTLTFISSKQLRKSRYGSLGNPHRMERLISWLSRINRMNSSKQIQDEVERRVVKQVTKTALAWHRGALEDDTPETRFINHWISLEHIFKPLKSPNKCKRSKIREKSTADMTVLALAKILAQQYKNQILLDLWGDIVRLGLLGPYRILAPNDGDIKYSIDLLGMPVKGRLYYVPDDNFSRPKLKLVQNGHPRTFKLQPGTIVLSPDRERVSKGQWIAGARIKTDEHTKELSLLFKGLVPNAENLLYLAFYERNIERFSSNSNSYLVDCDEKKDLSIPAIEAMRWYDRVNYHLPPEDDIKKFLEEPNSIAIDEPLKSMSESIPQYKPFFELYQKLRCQAKSFLDDNPDLADMILFEAFRNQTPKEQKMYEIFKEGKVNFDTDQPLLKLRMQDVSEFLKCDDKCLRINFITEADRMRRARNEIFHNANVPSNIDILVSRLYKYARIYLREIIYNLANSSDSISIEKLLYNRLNKL